VRILVCDELPRALPERVRRKASHLIMSWRDIWPSSQPPPDAEDPDQGGGGMSQLGAYDAGLTDDPGSWVQPVTVYWSPRLDPRSPEYDPEFAARVEWQDPSPDQDGPEWEPGG
jgi:hypothetical protein